MIAASRKRPSPHHSLFPNLVSSTTTRGGTSRIRQIDSRLGRLSIGRGRRGGAARFYARALARYVEGRAPVGAWTGWPSENRRERETPGCGRWRRGWRRGAGGG